MKNGLENLVSEADRVDLNLLMDFFFGSALSLFDCFLVIPSILLVCGDFVCSIRL
jgi:hypothetical protein